MIVDANFSQIGGNELRGGVFRQNGTNASWAIFEFNGTVNFSTLSIQQIQPKNITMNASVINDTSGTYGSFDLPSFVATVLLVNMSAFGCPPAGQSAPFPMVSGYNISNSSPVFTPIQAVGCTQNTTLCQYTDTYGPGTFNGTHWVICAPNFGGATTNFTAIASTGNFSAIPNFTIEVPGKAKIVFQTNVSFDNQQKSQAIMEFAMKSAMSGGRIGINDTEYGNASDPTKPNLNLSARLTIYNVSGQTGISGKPQLFKMNYDGSSLQSCPPSVCSNIVWDGQNITFTVSSFSSYQVTDAINLTLNTPYNNNWTNSKTINFTYIPVWNSSITISNCTLFGNFSGSWIENATNASSLVNGTINGISTIVDEDKPYLWNIECYDNTGLGDTGASNYTIRVDSVTPKWFTNQSSTPTNYSSTASQFNITWNDTISPISVVLITIKNSTNSSDIRVNNASMTNSYGGDIYNYSIVLPAGTWNWTSYANDSANNWNASDIFTFSIGKETPTFLTSVTSPIVYGTASDYGGDELNTEDSDCTYILERNATPIGSGSSVSDTTVLGAGAYNYTYYTAGCTNYTTTSDEKTLTVAQAPTSVTLYLNGSTSSQESTYPNATINASAVSNITGAHVRLFRNGVMISNATYFSYNISSLIAGNYTFTANILGNDNYTSASNVSRTWNISIGTNPVNLYLNGTQNSNRTYNYSQAINATGTSSAGTVFIYRNEVHIINGTSPQSEQIILGNGTYAYTINATGNENYSDNATGLMFYAIVNKGTPTSYLNLYIDSNSSNKSITYPSIANITANESLTGDSNCTYTLWRNNGTVDTMLINGSAVYNYTQLGNGTYAFKYNMSGTCSNWTLGNSSTYYLSVSKGTPDLHMTIDGAESNKSMTYDGTTRTVIGYENNDGDSDVNYTLWRNSDYIGNGTTVTNSQILTAATYTYVYNNTAGENYTASSLPRALTISAASSGVSITGTSSGTSTSSSTYVRVAIGKVNITSTSIIAGNRMVANIAKYQDVAIRGMNITVTNNVANIKIVINKVAVLPSTVPYDIPGKVYHYISIDKMNITDSDISIINFNFAVNKTWLNNSKVDPSNITLYRWANSRWNNLNAVKTSESAQEVFYSANSSGLSVFVIGTKGVIPELPAPTEETMCTENWQCVPWSACSNNFHARTCTDANACGTTTNKPTESEACTTEQAAVTPPSTSPFSIITFVIVIVIAIIVSVFIFLERTKITAYLGTLSKKTNHNKKHEKTSYMDSLPKRIKEQIEDEEEKFYVKPE